MKAISAFLVMALLAGCNAPKDEEPMPEGAAAGSPPAAAPAPAEAPKPASTSMTASATGTVESIDEAAHSITIAHGPVESLKWPAMTMTFQAPGVDLSNVKPGDRVSFEFTSTGMDGTIVSIAKQ